MGKTSGCQSRRVGKLFWAVCSPAELRNLGVGMGAQRDHMVWREQVGGLRSQCPDLQPQKLCELPDLTMGVIAHPVRHQ